ncbi:hypothetical protein ACFFV7_40650 [Nonomuraea spiralis]|uniref:Uncharacterized protein n=1 Tax=Nonomuraea spiralis TaxID=46182 RepID=A0ABV5ISQ7_9ACTN|nr:hypothetical protein [Nonomuraea spiralis]
MIIGALRDLDGRFQVPIGERELRAPTPGSGLSRVLAAAGRLPGHRRIRLGPLGLTDVTELIRRETGHDPGAEVARGIHARTAGNPFFVQELSRLLSDGGSLGDGGASVRAGVPATVRDVVRDRMSGLDDSAHGLLRIAAVIDRGVDLDLLARAIGVDAADCLERLEPLQALGLLETKPEDPSSWRLGAGAPQVVGEAFGDGLAVRMDVFEGVGDAQMQLDGLQSRNGLGDRLADQVVRDQAPAGTAGPAPPAHPRSRRRPRQSRRPQRCPTRPRCHPGSGTGGHGPSRTRSARSAHPSASTH